VEGVVKGTKNARRFGRDVLENLFRIITRNRPGLFMRISDFFQTPRHPRDLSYGYEKN